MAKLLAAASAAAIVAAALATSPLTQAAAGDRTVSLDNGQIRCLLSADYLGRGLPSAVCGRIDGVPFSVAPAKQNLVVVQGTGQTYYDAGAVPGSGSADAVLSPGGTYQANGWTVRAEQLRTLITYDTGGHGIRVNMIDVSPVWI